MLRTLTMLLLALSAACASDYKTIDFCWTTDHRLEPNERFVVLQATPAQVESALEEWVEINDGTIETIVVLTHVVRASESAKEEFAEARAIAERYWNTIERYEFTPWEDEEWERLQVLSRLQIEEEPTDSVVRRLHVLAGQRSGQMTYSEAVGTSFTPIVGPGFITIMPTTTYENRTREVSFVRNSITSGHVPGL